MTFFTREENGKNIKHVIPSKFILSKIQEKISCTEPGCDKMFTLLQNMQLHITQTHQHKKFMGSLETDCEQRFYCPFEKCIYQYNPDVKLKYFKKLKYVKQHYLKVHADKTFHCDKCIQSFSTSAYLTAHKVHCSMQIVCSCGKIYGSISSLQTHARRSQHEVDYMFATGKKRKATKELMSTSATSSKRTSAVSIAPAPKSEIYPKNQHSHINAAIALSELAVARFKRISAVDIGVQTEISPHKRTVKRLSSSGNSAVKLKLTTETETQTHLTNQKKTKKSRKMRSISTSSTPFDKLTDKKLSNEEATNNFSNNGKMITLTAKCIKPIQFRDVEIQCKANAPSQFDMKLANNNYVLPNSSNITESEIDSIPFLISSNLANDSSQSGSRSLYNLSESSVSQPDICSAELTSIDNYSYIIPAAIDESMHIVKENNVTLEVVPDYSMSPITTHTSTGCDVFLNSNLPNICGGFASSETQTDNYVSGCSSETQTCEDFSEIEQYLCSTIHTQTVEVPDDLFPDLNFIDNYTQTGMNDIPNFNNIA